VAWCGDMSCPLTLRSRRRTGNRRSDVRSGALGLGRPEDCWPPASGGGAECAPEKAHRLHACHLHAPTTLHCWPARALALRLKLSLLEEVGLAGDGCGHPWQSHRAGLEPWLTCTQLIMRLFIIAGLGDSG